MKLVERIVTGILISAVFGLPLRLRAQTNYVVGKIEAVNQSDNGVYAPDGVEPFQFNAVSSVQGTITTPLGQVDPLTYNSFDMAYEVIQNFATQALMDQMFPSGTYTFTLPGQATLGVPISGDLYPPVPLVVNGTWSGRDLLVDSSTDVSINFVPFPGFNTSGVSAQVLVKITQTAGPDIYNNSWLSETSAFPGGIVIPAGTMSDDSYYSMQIDYGTNPVIDNSSHPGAFLLATYLTVNRFTIHTQPLPKVGPVAVTQPQSQTLANGSTAVFSFIASGTPAPSYQWYLHGAPIAAAQSLLVLRGVSAANAGDYVCIASNATGSVQSSSATLTISNTTDIGRLINISCRAQVGTGGNTLIAGFATGGGGTSGTQKLLIRGSGPALGEFGLTGTLKDPKLTLSLESNGNFVASNDAWLGSSQISAEASALSAFNWNDTSSHDAALLSTLAEGPYTAQIAGESGDTGVALAEVYDATPASAYTLATPRLINISARVQVGTGANILIAGFVIGGTTSKTVLIRASGPALGEFGLTGTLPDPLLGLYSSTSTAPLATNAAWGGDPQISAVAASVGAFAWNDSLSKDAAILVTLPPGAYTAQVAGGSGDTGVALVEVYEVP